MFEAGWYHAEGDPPGTVRRWNGDMWIGVPIPDPMKPKVAAAQQHGPRLSEAGISYSKMTLGAMSVLAALFAATGIYIFLQADQVNRVEVVRLGNIDIFIGGIRIIAIVLLLGVLVTAAVFIAWIREAAGAARIHRYRQATGGTKTSTAPLAIGLTLLLLFCLFAPLWFKLRSTLTGEDVRQILLFGAIPFALIAALWLALQATLAGVAGSSKSGLFSVISDTTMAASYDPQTRVSGISPVKIFAWWALWWVPFLVANVAMIWAYVSDTIEITQLQNFIRLLGALALLETMSLLFIMTVVAQVTKRLSDTDRPAST